MNKSIAMSALLLATLFLIPDSAFAEFRSAKDMQKECRVALEVLQQKVTTNFQNGFFAGECIGYVQGAVDVAQVLAENVSWYKICTPDDVPTSVLIRKFIAFVDKYPKYTLAATAIQVMLLDEYPCQK